MGQEIVIKGSQSAITVKLPPEISFDELTQKVAAKFRQSAKMLGDSQVILGFSGRELSDEEESILLENILANCSLQVPYLLDPDKEKEQFWSEYLMLKQYKQEQEYREKIKEQAQTDHTETLAYQQQHTQEHVQSASLPAWNNTLEEVVPLKNEFVTPNDVFYKGTLRSGSELYFEHSVVVLGDVKEGATIISDGNIIVLGALKGVAIAGKNGNEKAFIIALSLEPVQLRIGGLIAILTESPKDKKAKKEKKEKKLKRFLKENEPVCYEPRIAYVDKGEITVELVGKNIYDEIDLY